MRVLDDGLARAEDPAPLAALLGRQLLERGEIARARDVLRSHAPAIAEAPEYHLLLAASHRQAGDHAAAAEHYRALTGVLPRSGAAWIGLGASLESLEQPAEAAKAYNRALEGDDDRAARFARQRLAALAPITGEPQ
jgi:tetratricopeptide (TPR) repeat protein